MTKVTGVRASGCQKLIMKGYEAVSKTTLVRRMKGYEAVSKTTLVRRMPVILRIDGRAFHTFTKGFERPYDGVLVEAMQQTMLALCEAIQGAVVGYTQSDEITIVLVDYKKLDSQPWFANEVQKMSSIAASIATMEFNRIFRGIVRSLPDTVSTALIDNYVRKAGTAMFDCRAFNIPKEEVTNNLYWRQIDARRNSVEMLGRTYFSNKELYKKSCRDIRAMLLDKGVNWEELPTYLKQGACAIKQWQVGLEREKWIIDKDIPLFAGADREYIDRFIFVGEEV